MRALSTHLRFALRTLRRAPAFTAISVLCLAVGIGAITTMAEVVDLLLFRPPPHVRAAAIRRLAKRPASTLASIERLISH